MPTAIVIALIGLEGTCFSAFCLFLTGRHNAAHQELCDLLREIRASRDDYRTQVDVLTRAVASLKRTISRLTAILRQHNIAIDMDDVGEPETAIP